MDTQGFISDTINLITDNLRDRYSSGFPILKELIQNADDANARTFVFARHPGFPEADHPLLQGPGLWFFNDGGFKSSDKRALRSFGINSKAGDAVTIGKFGLGMKSVFHLCEALFYVAWDGAETHCEALNPWKTADDNLHPEWDGRKDSDWDHLIALAHSATGMDRPHWFLLWLPLRLKAHLQHRDGSETGAIIERFPLDDHAQDLAFLSDEALAQDLAEILPLLRHLETVEHRGPENPFSLHLDVDARLIGPEQAAEATGTIKAGCGATLLRFAGLRRNNGDSWAHNLKSRSQWPKSRYRDEYGREHTGPDKAIPEGAVLFCSTPSTLRAAHLRWAVFLPLEEGGECLMSVDRRTGHSLVLHGQFFVDAGRRRVHHQNGLHETPVDLGSHPIDESTLRQAWNQLLAQRVLAPAVIPALDRYVRQLRLGDAECRELTQALSGSGWFHNFRDHVCGQDAWVRALERDGPLWRRVQGSERERMRPAPTPTKADPSRPWRVLPQLEAMGLLLCDASAPALADRRFQWREDELDQVLADVTGIFSDGPSMDYLEAFLSDQAVPFLATQRLSMRLVELLRGALRLADRNARQAFSEKGKRLIGCVPPNQRLELVGELPDSVLRSLWGLRVPILLVPKGSCTDPGQAVPDESALTGWLTILDQAITKEHAGIESVLDTIHGLLERLDREARGRFLRIYDNLRVIAVRDPRTGSDRAASSAEVREAREAGTLFGFAPGIQERDRLGLSKLVAAVLPMARVWLVRADTYRAIFPNEPAPHRADSARACLAALGHDTTGRLGDMQARQDLLERANDPGDDPIARRGLRYLLHGNIAHKESDGDILWFPGHGQHTAWSKLWGQIYGMKAWSLIPAELLDALPRRWKSEGAQEIAAPNLIAEIEETGRSIDAPQQFSREEREEILSQIQHADTWRRLPLHTRTDDQPVAVDQGFVYLSPDSGVPDGPLFARATLIKRGLDPRVGEQQRRWLKPLDDRARIELAFASANPVDHWSIILEAINRLGTTLDVDLLQSIRETAWLPTCHGRPVCPSDVIDLPAGMADEARRLIGEHRDAFGVCFAVPSDLSETLVDQPAWLSLARTLCAVGEAGLERLALLLTDLPNYQIGPWPTIPVDEDLAFLARCPELPGWRLLASAQATEIGFDREAAWFKLQDGLTQMPTSDRLRAMLAWLTSDTNDWPVRKSIFDRYLGWLIDVDGHRITQADLGRLQLASVDRQWRMATELCAGAHGIDQDYLLDEDQAMILESSIRRADTGQIEADGIPTRVTRADFDAALETTDRVLADYFKPWAGGWIPEPMIGVVLGLLGRRARAQADAHMHTRPLDLLLNEIPWVDPGGDALNRNWMHGLDRDLLMSKIEVAVQVPAGDCIEVPNLLGDWISVPIAREIVSLLMGGIHWMGGYRALVQLRHIDPPAIGEKGLGRLLKAAAEVLYAGLYNQPRTDFSGLWQELARSDQIEISVARRLILDNVPFYLRQLTTSHGAIHRALKRCDECRSRIAEVEAKGRDASRERKSQFEAIEDLARLIDGDNDAAKIVLDGVRAKLTQYQYELSSIPFELFQNADDAAVELGQIEAHPQRGCKIPAAARRVVLESVDTGLRLFHWGRPINARGPSGFDGDERGFGQDLEKMLILSASDKVPEQGVTGKFGLGFKSVLLACDRPRILSGRLALEVNAGILPQPCADVAELRQALNHHTLPGYRGRGTMIDLPGVNPPQRARILERFLPLAGILCVFARAIRLLSVFDGKTERRFSWEAKEIAPGVEHGRLDLEDDAWGSQCEALCLRTEGRAILLALGPGGFRALPKRTPTLWVTAPMRETDGFGFACTAPFDLDPGRARLAGDSATNLAVAKDLGSSGGSSLAALLERGRSDWVGLRRDLGIDPALEPHDLWYGLWICVTERCLARPKDGGAAGLARAVALALLRRLSASPAAIPNGLGGVFRGMIDSGDAHYHLPKRLGSPEAIDILDNWARFTARYPRQRMVSELIGRILREGDIAKPVAVGVAALVALVDPPEVAPEDSAALGGIWLLTEDDQDWADDDMKRRLRQLRFRTDEDTWEVAANLVAGAAPGIEKDEVLRHDLAPKRRRLHPAYREGGDEATAGMAFFLLARERLQADTEDLATWVLAADAHAGKHAALVYLSDGELGQGVADRVKGQGWLANALFDQMLLTGLEPRQIERLQARLASSSQLQAIWQPPPAPEPWRPSLDLGTVLKRVADWWVKDGPQLEHGYRQKLYPSASQDLTLDASGRIRDRASWLTLFALGAFQSMGLTREQQHRGFIEHCRTKGWWKTLALEDPKKCPECWMDVIEKYAEDQYHDEEWAQWIGYFPKLYRLRRWMDDYVDLFLSIDRFQEPFALEALLAPRSNPHFQGGGIDSPPLTRTFKVGGPLVIRELLRHEVIKNPLAVAHAYAPIERIRIWFRKFCVDVETSQDIYETLCKHLGESEAAFGGAYDIPLRILTLDEDLQVAIFR